MGLKEIKAGVMDDCQAFGLTNGKVEELSIEMEKAESGVSFGTERGVRFKVCQARVPVSHLKMNIWSHLLWAGVRIWELIFDGLERYEVYSVNEWLRQGCVKSSLKKCLSSRDLKHKQVSWVESGGRTHSPANAVKNGGTV